MCEQEISHDYKPTENQFGIVVKAMVMARETNLNTAKSEKHCVKVLQ